MINTLYLTSKHCCRQANSSIISCIMSHEYNLI